MNERVILTADEGMVLTNGTDYGTIIYLAEGIDPSGYHQITEEQYHAMMESEMADDADYQAALARLGVR